VSLFPRAFRQLWTWRRDGADRERAPHADGPRRPSRWKGILIAVLFAGSVGLLLHHAIAKRRALTELVPQTALFYLEVSDPGRVLTGWRATRAWRDLIGDANEPAVRTVLRTPDLGEWLELFRSPMALVVTGLDWTGDTLRPHLALLWMTEWPDEALRRFAERHVAALAHRAYGAFTIERTTYGGTPIVGYRARASEKGLFWSARERVLILATHPDVIRAIVETAEGQRKWQYKTLDWGELRKLGAIVTGKDFVDENVDAGLNKLGEEGWELVGVYVDGFVVHRSQKSIDIVSISRYVKFTFKRPVE